MIIDDDSVATLVRQLRGEIERLRADLQHAVSENLAFNVKVASEINEARSERDAYRAMLCDLLAAAHPHPPGHPMNELWMRARELLKNGPAKP